MDGEDAEYQQAKRALLEPSRFEGAGLLLLGTLALFVLGQGSCDEDSLPKIALLVVVLLFHELGHFLGMKLFGYRDVRMFFIPFFGAAVSGKHTSVAAWKEAVVSLLGPIPGILLGLGLLVSLEVSAAPRPVTREAAVLFIALNAFNLVPLAALDGGKFAAAGELSPRKLGSTPPTALPARRPLRVQTLGSSSASSSRDTACWRSRFRSSPASRWARSRGRSRRGCSGSSPTCS